jgi:(p)ppGpp synthase/HD superfamily hydrolase
VEGCSDSVTEPGQPKAPWRERKEAYLAAIPHKDAATRHVSLADKLANARDILADYRRDGEAVWKRFKGGRDGSLWYYRSLVEAFQRAESDKPASRLLQELDATVTLLEERAA